MKIGDLVKSKHEPSALGLVLELPKWTKDIYLDDEEQDDYDVAYILWVRDEVEPLYKCLEEIQNLEVVDVQSR